MTAAQLLAEKEKLKHGIAEARLTVARFEGALEFVEYLLAQADKIAPMAESSAPEHKE